MRLGEGWGVPNSHELIGTLLLPWGFDDALCSRTCCSFVPSESGLPLLFRGIHRRFGKQSCSFCIWHQIHLHGRCFILRKQNVFVSLHKLYLVKKLVALTAYRRWASISDMSCISCYWGFSFQTKEITNDYLEKGFWVTREKEKNIEFHYLVILLLLFVMLAWSLSASGIFFFFFFKVSIWWTLGGVKAELFHIENKFFKDVTCRRVQMGRSKHLHSCFIEVNTDTVDLLSTSRVLQTDFGLTWNSRELQFQFKQLYQESPWI